ncbi:MAG: alpha/beta hydrolase [Rhizomicrobium sp.]|jgi:pimeloyl-ACP methyl ester carboxylesterase
MQRMLPLGGIDQYISIKSRHRGNPILLFLHGGPGLTSIPVSYVYMRDWPEHFTLVQWDQRGAGRTFADNDLAKMRSSMRIDTMVNDAEELVRWLRATFGQQRVVLMGHSWGTILGIRLIERHPDWFYAYVGMGQFVDFQKSEAMGYAATIAAARAERNSQAVSELDAISPYPDLRNPARSYENMTIERRWLERYDGDEEGSHEEVARLSPDYSADDLRARDQGQAFSLQALWEQISHVDFSRDTEFGCPIIILQGRRDVTTSSLLASRWFETVRAPYKKFVLFDNSAHMLFEEEPAKVLDVLVNDILPLTRPPAAQR